jgi:predicted DNA-binding transcriptional regulator YafY
MPRTKDPQARLQRLNDLFLRSTSAQAVLKLEDIARRLDISIRQLRVDFDQLKDMGAPLEYDRILRGWRYRPGEPFSIVDNIALTGEDLSALRIAIEMVSKANHLRRFDHLPKVFEKIYRAARRWLAPDENVLGKIVYFDPVPQYDGSKHLHFFLEAIERKRRVEFTYQPFHEGGTRKVQFDPWFLRYYDRRWYVGGWPHDTGEHFVRVFPLERIAGTPATIGYSHDKPPTFDAQSYWRYIYGITTPPDGLIEDIVLSFNSLQGKYFESSPFFEPFDIVERTSDHLVVRFQMMINIELTRKIASFGADVEVLSPPRLRERIREFHQQAVGRYPHVS